ncbi:MAG TPA: hypothetical protein VG722_08790, partial [Tepidisphaeraceae bacterium]|nr:hypothetical protein [Tepidisphaeraceae bacterium]
MHLTHFGYVEHDGTPDRWRLEPFALKKVNLIVGRNATGKSRTLAVIRSLAQAVMGKLKVNEGEWDASFRDGNDELCYKVAIVNGIVTKESFKKNGKELLNREISGDGTVHAVDADTKLRFKVPENELAITAKRDLVQHPFLEPMHAWAESLRFYPFGTFLGRQLVVVPVERGPKPDLTDPDQVVSLFRAGEKNFPRQFHTRVISYMKRIGYDLEEVQVSALPDVSVQGPFPNLTAIGVNVKERDLPCWTYQTKASQGMFRALSIVGQFAYSELASNPSAILI